MRLSSVLAAAALVVLVSGCDSAGSESSAPAGSPTGALGSTGLLGAPADAIAHEFGAAGFVPGELVPTEARALDGRTVHVLVHKVPGGFARVLTLDDPVSRVVLSVVADDAAIQRLVEILNRRGLVDAAAWVDGQQVRTRSDPTLDRSESAALNGLTVDFKVEAAEGDAASAVVTVLVRP